jgi:hypothetical protein
MEELDPKLKKWAIAGVGLLLTLALVDLVALRGDSVGGGSVDLRTDSQPLVLTITRPAEKHLVKLTTRRRLRDEMTGQSISYQLVDPHGEVVVSDSELLAHKQRFFSFYPHFRGDYLLFAEETKLLGSSRGSARVSVTVNDRRTISRWLGF